METKRDMIIMKSLNENPTMCSICYIAFTFWGVSKHSCAFCFKPVCSRCSMQKAYHQDTGSLKRICDTCHSDSIKFGVISQNKIELERLKFELSNLKRRLETERLTSEKEGKCVDELNQVIEETKDDAVNREEQRKIEMQMLQMELSKIEAGYQEVMNRLELLCMQNHDLDERIVNALEQNELFSGENIEKIEEKMSELRKDINEYSLKLKVGNATVNENKDAKIVQLTEEIECMRIEKNRNLVKLYEMREAESIKESSISMLLTTLSNNSTMPDANYVYNSFDDEEAIRMQLEEISDLREKIAKRKRKNELDNRRCTCQTF